MTPEQFVAIRQQLELDRTELCELLGVEYWSVWKWENGKSVIPKHAAQTMRLIDAVGVKMARKILR